MQHLSFTSQRRCPTAASPQPQPALTLSNAFHLQVLGLVPEGWYPTALCMDDMLTSLTGSPTSGAALSAQTPQTGPTRVVLASGGQGKWQIGRGCWCASAGGAKGKPGGAGGGAELPRAAALWMMGHPTKRP